MSLLGSRCYLQRKRGFRIYRGVSWAYSNQDGPVPIIHRTIGIGRLPSFVRHPCILVSPGHLPVWEGDHCLSNFRHGRLSVFSLLVSELPRLRSRGPFSSPGPVTRRPGHCTPMRGNTIILTSLRLNALYNDWINDMWGANTLLISVFFNSFASLIAEILLLSHNFRRPNPCHH